MNTPMSVPPRPLPRTVLARVAGAERGFLWRVMVGDRSCTRFSSNRQIAGSNPVCSHRARSGYPEHRQAVLQHLPRGHDKRQPRALQCRILDQETFRLIVTVEFLGQILEIESHLM